MAAPQVWKNGLCAAALALPLTVQAQGSGGRSVTQGRGVAEVANIFDCPGSFTRPSPVGAIKSKDGKSWPLPAANAFRTGTKAGDLYNECAGAKPANLAQVAPPPIVEIDPDGEVVTGYLMADNYFELYVNGKLVGVDAIPFTPFNSAVVRFRVKKPYTYAVKLIDWEENLGLGTESGGASGGHHPGDGGFIARFSDGVITDASWKAQSFYIAPLASPEDVTEKGAVHDTAKLGRTYPAAASQAACADRCYAVHYPIPADWNAKTFNAAAWPDAALFSRAEMGVERNAAFANFPTAFGDAKVIWSSNLVFDNLVLARKIVR